MLENERLKTLLFHLHVKLESPPTCFHVLFCLVVKATCLNCLWKTPGLVVMAYCWLVEHHKCLHIKVLSVWTNILLCQTSLEKFPHNCVYVFLSCMTDKYSCLYWGDRISYTCMCNESLLSPYLWPSSWGVCCFWSGWVSICLFTSQLARQWGIWLPAS